MTGDGPPAGAHALELGGVALWLLPEGAVWWPGTGRLLLADTHFGKGASFRRAGLAVPRGSTAATLGRLGALVTALGARQVIILGDVLHAALPEGDPLPRQLAEWRARRPGVVLTAVRGNHDRTPERLGALLDWHEESLHAPPFVLRHHPLPDHRGPVIAGHLHPLVRLQGPARDSLRLPAFVLEDALLTLPAFGEFTGGHPVGAAPGRRRYAAAGYRVIPLERGDSPHSGGTRDG